MHVLIESRGATSSYALSYPIGIFVEFDPCQCSAYLKLEPNADRDHSMPRSVHEENKVIITSVIADMGYIEKERGVWCVRGENGAMGDDWSFLKREVETE